MNRLLTTLLIWLLMATLPLHTLAASAGMSCVSVLPPSASASASAPAAAHASHAASGEEHAHHGDHAASAQQAAPGDEVPHAKANKQTHSSCSACSAFCAGAVAPPSFSLPLPLFDGSDAVVAAPADFAAGFIPDGLQRPPRQ